MKIFLPRDGYQETVVDERRLHIDKQSPFLDQVAEGPFVSMVVRIELIFLWEMDKMVKMNIFSEQIQYKMRTPSVSIEKD